MVTRKPANASAVGLLDIVPLRAYLPVFALAFIVAAFGGSSRYDNVQFVFLQPLSWFLVAMLLLRVRYAELSGFRTPILLLGGIAALTALQLVPLPASLWTQLPGREVVADIDRAMGVELWRPLSMVPARTLHALSNLAIPAAALLSFMKLRTRSVVPIAVAICALAALNAALGFLQFAFPASDVLRFYHGPNTGQPIGLFANPNHAGVFAAINLVFIAVMLAAHSQRMSPQTRIGLVAVYILVFLIGIMSGSRAGLLTNAVALFATALIALFARGTSREGFRHAKQAKGRLVSLAAASVGGVIAATFILANRLPAFDALINADPLEDMRFTLNPVVWDMASSYFPFGTGFGTFEKVYYIHEPDALLQPAYINMAHNDWWQFLLEGGVLAGALGIAVLAWLVGIGLEARREGRSPEFIEIISTTIIVAIASAVDYPMRTPIFMLVMVWAVLCVAYTGVYEDGKVRPSASA